MKRRTYLTTASAFTITAVAGCMGDNDADEEENTDSANDETDDHDDDGTDSGGDESDENGEDEYPDLVGTFDDFEDLDAWETIAGALDPDGERVFEGSQSARLSAAESEERVRIRRELDEPIDVTGVVPGLALSTSRAANPIIQLHDGDGNYLQFQQHVREEHPFLRHNFGHTAVSGDPDLSEITEIQIEQWSGDESEAEFWVDDLHFVPRVEEGRVMFQFQGGFESDYTHAFPVLEEYDLTGSTFVATSRIRASEAGDGDRLTQGQLEELVDAGWSLGTVGARGLHMSELGPDGIEENVLDPLEWFDENGYDDARYYAFTGGRYDEGMYNLVEENYDLGFAGRYRSQGWASNPYTITRISGDEGQRNLDAEQMIDALDWTAEHGGITTIVFYEMDEEDASALEEAAAHLAELQSAGDLELIAPDEIANEYVL